MNMGAGQTNEGATARDSSKLRPRSFVRLFLDWILAGLPEPAPTVSDGPEIAPNGFRGFGSGSAVADDLAEPFLVSAMTDTPGVTIRQARSLDDLVGDADDAIDGIPAKLIEEVASSPAVMPELRDEDPFAAGRDSVKGLAGHSIPVAEPTPAEELHEILEAQARPLPGSVMPDGSIVDNAGILHAFGSIGVRREYADEARKAGWTVPRNGDPHRNFMFAYRNPKPSPAVAERIEATLDGAGTDLAACRLELEQADEMLATARAELAATEAMLEQSRDAHAVAIRIADQVERDLALVQACKNEWKGLAKARKRKLRRARRMLEEARVYTGTDSIRARAAIVAKYYEGGDPRTAQPTAVKPDELVDVVASALGMRKAGA